MTHNSYYTVLHIEDGNFRGSDQHMLVLIKSIPVPKINAVRVNLGICPLLCSQSACFLLKLEEPGIQIFHINFIIL